jgi:murein hydrolase activator
MPTITVQLYRASKNLLLHECAKLATSYFHMWQKIFIMAKVWCVILYASPSVASSIEAQKSALQDIKSSLEKAENARALTQTKLRHLSRDMQLLQQDIIEKATHVQKIERELNAQERKLHELAVEEAKKNEQLEIHKHYASTMVSAGWSLQHRPQLAAWLLPEENRERALTVRALHMTTLSLKHDMDKVTTSMRELEEIRFAMLQTQKDRMEMRKSLTKERASLQEQLGKQEILHRELQRDDDKYHRTMVALAKKAQNVSSLVASLEVQHEKETLAAMTPQEKPTLQKPPAVIVDNTARTEAINFAQAKGGLPLPAEGVVMGKFGEVRGQNDRLKGLELKTMASATVISPYEGEVLFVGPFLEYGNMVIIRHSKQYHTLLAGLSQINVRTGQFLLDGEPIGAMGKESNQRNLYLELRKDATAIDPAPWYALQKHHYAAR